ncbi:hypothetical protein [Raoultella planticola]|uniref:hypothetical protein n=1 Tax=Raoultella planticola TaxID=575 RepID=UPI0034E5A372
MRKIIAVALFAVSANALSAPPPNPPVFNLSVQTEDVNSALEHATKNIPALDKGKKYEVRVEVGELKPQPKEHDPRKALKEEKEKRPPKERDGKNPPPTPDAE